MLVFDKWVKEAVKKARGGLLEEFSEPWSEAYPCQSQGSRGDEFLEVHSSVHLLVLNFHNWPW